jgi:hypothetical protein
MSRLNQLMQPNGFWRSHEINSFSVTEIALYFHLLRICNICGNENTIKRNNAKIGADLSISINTLKNARNRLAQSGLLSFKTQNGVANTTYTLSNFDEVTTEVTTEVTDEVTTEVTDELNKTKNKTNNPPTPLPAAGDIVFEKNDFGFETVWEIYGRKGNKKTSQKKWANLKNHCREAALSHIPLYVESTPDKQYRKNFETYLNQECWNDEIINRNGSGTYENLKNKYQKK